MNLSYLRRPSPQGSPHEEVATEHDVLEFILNYFIKISFLLSVSFSCMEQCSIYHSASDIQNYVICVVIHTVTNIPCSRHDMIRVSHESVHIVINGIF